MKTHGIHIKGTLVAQNVSFNCLKCGKEENLEFRHYMSEKTVDCFKSMAEAKLCLNCYTDKKIPELVECLVN